MSDAAYFAKDALSQSGAKLLLRSPMQYRHDRANPQSPTPAMRLGTLVHALVLEPATVAGTFAVSPDLSGLCDDKGKPYADPGKSNAGKAIMAQFKADNPGKAVVSADDMAMAQAMADAALAAVHPTLGLDLRDLLALKSAKVEFEVYWQDADTGCDCKAKLDAVVTLADGSVLAIDLKTTTGDLTTAALSRTVANYGYHLQGAAYLGALAQGGVCDAEFWIIWVAGKAPHEVAWTKLAGNALTIGAQHWAAAQRIYAACAKSGNWPSAQECGLVATELDVPRWADNALD